MSSFLAYEAKEKDYDAPEQPERWRVSFALADEAEKEEAGCSGASAHGFLQYFDIRKPLSTPRRSSTPRTLDDPRPLDPSNPRRP